MKAWLARWSRKRRATAYLKAHADDEHVVAVLLDYLDTLPLASPRGIAEAAAGRRLSDFEWNSIAPVWERPWTAIV